MDSDDRFDDYDDSENSEDSYDDAPQTPDDVTDTPSETPSGDNARSRPRKDREAAPKRSPGKTAAKSSKPSKAANKPVNKAAKPKSEKKKHEKKPPAPPPPRGKWTGGKPAERVQRLRWIGWLLWRWAPAILILLIVLAVFLPPLIRGVQPIPVIAPFYTREVQYWAPQIQKWSTQYDVNPNLIATLMQIESCGLPGAASNVGAQGLFQVMPMHFSDDENMTDPETNARRGIGVIRECLGYAEGDVGLAMACYNGGPSLIYRDSSTWPLESQRYYAWGTGLYNDAVRGRQTSEALDDWLAAGGSGLCNKAAMALNLPTTEPDMLRPPVTQRPPLPTAALATAAPANVQPQGPTPTLQPFTPLPGDLPTFALDKPGSAP